MLVGDFMNIRVSLVQAPAWAAVDGLHATALRFGNAADQQRNSAEVLS
jgi:hypothetical protein